MRTSLGANMAMRWLAVLAGVVLLGASDPSAADRVFVGSWNCAGTSWTFAPFNGSTTWLRVDYAAPSTPNGGSAIVGYVPLLGKFVYRDFHSDGAYADLTAAPPVDNRWLWSGPYYAPGLQAVLNGRITYVVVDAKRYDRIFETERDGNFVKMGGDSCVRTSS